MNNQTIKADAGKLDEAIEYHEHIADIEEKACFMIPEEDGDYANHKRYAEDHRQLAECLKDYKRLLEQEPKTGHWINVDETHSKCDRCGAVFEIVSENGEANYCSNCGAKMVEPQESEE